MCAGNLPAHEHFQHLHRHAAFYGDYAWKRGEKDRGDGWMGEWDMDIGSQNLVLEIRLQKSMCWSEAERVGR